MSLNKFLCLLSPPTILNGFLLSLVFWNLLRSKIVHFNFHKDICIFEATMASEASENVFDRKSRISPRIPDFSGFLLDQVTRGDLRIPKN